MLLSSLFYPGLMNADAVDLMLQGPYHRYSTWHSPALAFAWSFLGGPGPMFLLMQFFYFSGVLLYVRGLPSQVSAAVVSCFFVLNPPLLCLLAFIGKDSICVSLLLLSAGSAFQAMASRRRAWACLTLCSLFAAVLVRIDAVLPAIPIAALVISGLRLKERRWKRLIVPAAVIVFMAASTLAHRAAGVLLSAERLYPVQVPLLYDLLAIAVETGDAGVMPDWVRRAGFTLPEFGPRYNSFDSNPVFWNNPSVIPLTRSPREWDDLARTWRNGVLSHPVIYVRHRLRFAEYMLRFHPLPDYLSFLFTTVPRMYLPDPERWGAEYTKSRVAGAVEAWGHRLCRTPLKQGWFYVLILAGGGFYLRREKFYVAIAASGCLSIGAAAALAGTAELRFSFWLFVTGVIVAAGVWRRGRDSHRRADVPDTKRRIHE